MKQVLGKLIFLLVLVGFLLFFRPKPVWGLVNCCDSNHPDSGCRFSDDCAKYQSKLLKCCYSDCQSTDWVDTSLDKCQGAIGKPTNTCCTSSGSCDSNCGSISQWTYCYGVCQKKANSDISGACLYQYRYAYRSCGTADSCIAPHPYLNAGRCDLDGCTVGGIYKTCCNADGTGTTVNCQHGQFTGTCPEGSITKLCGFGEHPACGAAACASLAQPTATPTPSCTCTEPIAAPTLTSPDNGATNQPINNLTLSWNGIGQYQWGEDCNASANNYVYKVYLNGNWINQNPENPLATSFTVSGLNFNTTYTWYVEAWNGCKGRNSESRTFTTVSAPTNTPTPTPTNTPNPTLT